MNDYKYNKLVLITLILSSISALLFLALTFCAFLIPWNDLKSVFLPLFIASAVSLFFCGWNSYKNIKITIYRPQKTQEEIGSKRFGDDDDLLPGRISDAKTLLKVIKRNASTNERAYGIYADYGIGKSDFIERFVNLCKEDENEVLEPYVFNASLVDDFNDASITLIRFLIANNLLTNKTIWKIMDTKVSFSTNPFINESSMLNQTFKKIDFLQKIKSIIKEELKDKNIVIIIDELDRTKPEFALKLLESTRYYFSGIPNFSFVLSISIKHFGEILKNHYGVNQCSEFLQKYISFPISLTTVDFNTYLTHFFEKRTQLPSKEKKLILKNVPLITFNNLRECEQLAKLIKNNKDMILKKNNQNISSLFLTIILSWKLKVNGLLNLDAFFKEHKLPKEIPYNQQIFTTIFQYASNLNLSSIKKMFINFDFQIPYYEEVKKMLLLIPNKIDLNNYIEIQYVLELTKQAWKKYETDKILINKDIWNENITAEEKEKLLRELSKEFNLDLEKGKDLLIFQLKEKLDKITFVNENPRTIHIKQHIKESIRRHIKW